MNLFPSSPAFHISLAHKNLFLRITYFIPGFNVKQCSNCFGTWISFLKNFVVYTSHIYLFVSDKMNIVNYCKTIYNITCLQECCLPFTVIRSVHFKNRLDIHEGIFEIKPVIAHVEYLANVSIIIWNFSRPIVMFTSVFSQLAGILL